MLRAGLAVALSGHLIATLGLFTLPVQQLGRIVPGAVGYVEIRGLALTGNKDHLFASAFAAFWWGYGLLAVVTVLVALLIAAVLGAPPRPIGIALAAVALVPIPLQVLALAQTRDYRGVYVGFGLHRPPFSNSMLAGTAFGVWIGLAGLAILAVGGVLIALTPRGHRLA
ncbi:MAG: hypothetical protein DLM59_17540 [Pseudonocardiales bacterium]|nr:MAG: hypothetical protein DLM59_17540 [Pseudonocardiales bacterium]